MGTRSRVLGRLAVLGAVVAPAAAGLGSPAHADDRLLEQARLPRTGLRCGERSLDYLASSPTGGTGIHGGGSWTTVLGWPG
jgi:hypothetical protein